MDDAGRFLRYVVPGALFAGETVLFLYLLWPDWVSLRFRELAAIDGVAVGIGGLLGTGVLGYVFSSLHFFLQENHLVQRLPYYPRFDFTGLIQTAMNANLLKVIAHSRDGTPRSVDVKKIDRNWAHELSLALWHERGDKPKMKDSNPRLTGLFHVAHSHGISGLATVMSLILVLVIGVARGQPPLNAWRVVAVTGLGAFMLWMCFDSYARMSRFCQAIGGQVMLDVLHDERSSSGEETITRCLVRADLTEREPQTATMAASETRTPQLAPGQAVGTSANSGKG
jgi:hypothetical protein